MRHIILPVTALALSGASATAQTQPAPDRAATARFELSPQDLLDLAAAAERAGDVATARTAYRALIGNRSSEVRNEARFRLALIEVASDDLTAAAVLLRSILDENPDAQRVRLELARVLERMGDESGALRTLRAAQAGGLPPDVARLVDRYSAALRSRKPFGATLEIALAPDSNINRATRSGTLGTVLGDFALDEDAQPRSGVGLALRGQVYARQKLSETVNLIARSSASAELYRHGEFNDLALGLSAGPEMRLGTDRLSLEVGPVWRWYGGSAYARNLSLSATYSHPIGRTSQVRASASTALIDNRRNALLDGHSFGGSVSWEQALSAQAGVSVTVAGERQALNDPAYSLTARQLALAGYREVGAVTLFASVSAGRLEADERLALLPEKRVDRSYRASFGIALRQLAVAGFAPLARLTLERNRSTVEIYDYRRLRTEFGVTRAF